MKKIILITLGLSLLFFETLYSQTNYWQGNVTSNWHYSGNWSLNHVPIASEDVVIPDVPGFFTPIVYGDALCNNLTINSGAYLDVSNTISLGGHYDNNAGSNTSINQITFNGSGIQNVYSLDCEILILDKAAGELRFPSETSSCNNYDWEQGLYRVSGGTFIINDLVDDGIFGTISVTAGQLDIHQSTDQYIDLNCTFFMTGGECNIYGGKENSWWTYAGNTSITMYDGTLRFMDNGIKVANSGYTFNENISGGYIESYGDFIVDRTNYNPTGGHIWLKGSADCIVGHHASSNLYSLVISKGSDGYSPKDYKRKHRKAKPYIDSKSNQVIATSELDLNGNISLSAGTFTPLNTMTVAGRWYTNPDYDGFNEGTSTVIFDGDEEAYIQLNETFYNVTINKTYDLSGGFVIQSLSSFTVLNDLTILDGSLEMVNFAYLSVGNNLLIESDAGLYISSETDPYINVSGNWQNNNTTFSSIHGFSPGISEVIFNGTSDQTIHSNCPDGDFYALTINSTSTISPSTNLHILDDFKIEDGIFNAPAELYVSGSWINIVGETAFNEGLGAVIFDGYLSGGLNYLTLGERFYNLIIDKSLIGAAAFYFASFTHVSILNDFQILDGSVYIYGNSSLNVANDVLIDLDAGLNSQASSSSICRILVGGNWQNNNTSFDDLAGFSPGSSVVEFNGTSTQNIISNCPAGDFDILKINSTATVQSAYNLHIAKINIWGGIFVAPPEIYVETSWANSAGEASFDEGTGLVVFDGSSDGYCSSEEFYHLEIDKPGAILHIGTTITDDTVYCVDMDWTAGNYVIWEESAFIIDDLVDDGIYGDITVDTDALLSITQGTANFEYVDLFGNLTIDGGEVHVYGGADNSYWGWGGNYSITMTNDAGLYFEDVGIQIINDAPYTFTENISSGEIHSASHFIVERDNFTPTASHIYMNGSEDAVLNIVTGSHLSSLYINKTNNKNQLYKKSPRKVIPQNSSKANQVLCTSDLVIQGDFTINEGSFSAPSEMWVRRDWVNNVGEAAFIENSGRVTFYGAVDSEIKYDEVFYDLCNHKDFDVRYLRTAENLNITVLNDLQLNQGVFYMETNNTVEIGNNVRFFEEASWWAGNAAISIAGDWDNQSTAPGVYSGFRAQNSTITFNGLVDQNLSCAYTFEEFYNLEINNTGGLGNDAFIPNSNIRVTNNLDVTDGHWSDIRDGNAHEFFGDVNVGIDAKWTDQIGIINLLGPTNKSFYNNGDGYFDVIMFNKDNPTDLVDVGGKIEFNYMNVFTGNVQLAMNNYLNHSAIYVDANGSLNFDAGASLISDPGAAITIYAGGKIAFNGTSGDNCMVTNNGGPGYYYFNIEGEIAAEYTDFNNMAADGITVLPAGMVDPLRAFNNCSFSYGESGGTYLAVNSNQNLTCDGATFHSNSWGGNSNVRKITNDGGILFTNYSGDFAGEDYDDDPFDRIQWDDGSREIDLTVMLEGPYNGGVMEASLYGLNILPNEQPFNVPPWNYAGIESVPNIPNSDIIDWILIEYRDAFDANSAIPATMIGRQAAFLLNDGSVVDLDGTSILPFNHSIVQGLFVVIYHRNHLAIMSADPVIESSGVYLYDFTTPAGQAYGTDAQKNLGGGVYGLCGGDGNADGTINADDKTAVWSIETGNSGYLNGDFNLDSQTDNLDKNDIWFDNIDNSSQVPE